MLPGGIQYISEIKQIVLSFEDDGKIVENAKNSVLCPTIRQDLLEIQLNYFLMLEYIEKSESVNYSVEDAIKDLDNINIPNDPCEINEYIKKRRSQNDMFSIPLMLNENISPYVYGLLLKSQATSISVERSFSMLNKINAKDRNFHSKNIAKYVILHYNLSDIN